MPRRSRTAAGPPEIILAGPSSDPDALRNAWSRALSSLPFKARLRTALGNEPRGLWQPDRSPWSALLAAARDSRAPFLIFWPAGLALDRAQLGSLWRANARWDWVSADRGALPALASQLKRSFLGLPGLDLGAPLRVRREALLDVAEALSADDPWLAARAASLLAAKGARLGSLSSKDETALGTVEALGVDLSHGRSLARRRGLLALASAALVAAGILLPKPAVISLTAFGLGLLGLGYSFGRAG